jgi:radial spoke head protein 4A
MLPCTADKRTQPRPAPKQYECEDIQGDAALFESLGVGLGRREMVDVALAAKRLGQDPRRGVATVRFFGKFLGTHADYYVFETTLQNPPAEPEEQPGARRTAAADVGAALDCSVPFTINAFL